MTDALFLDCDGILTTGLYLYDDSGKQYKEFSSVDSNAISTARESGMIVEVISSDPTGDDINEARCRDMGVPYHRAIDESKITVARRRLDELDCVWSEAAMMGDDVTDIDCLEAANIPITVPNAIDDVKSLVESRGGFITEKQGGQGAVAEAIRHLLSSEVDQ